MARGLGRLPQGGGGVMLKEEIIKMWILQSGGKGGHGVHRREDKGECQREDTIKRDTKRWNPWEGAKVSMGVPRGGSTSRGE